jgi:hypothetical protein
MSESADSTAYQFTVVALLSINFGIVPADVVAPALTRLRLDQASGFCLLAERSS